MPVIAEMLDMTTSLYKLSFTPAAQNGKEEAEPAESAMQRAFPGRRDWKLLQLGVNYRWSDVVFDERFVRLDGERVTNAYGVRDHDVRAGDRAPDAPGLVCLRPAADNAPNRLFDIYSPAMHTALIFGNGVIGDTDRPILEAVEALPAPLFQKVFILPSSIEHSSAPDLDITVDYVLSDVQGHAYKNFGVDEGGYVVVIVRPDAIVGAVALSEAGLSKYVSAVFNL